MHAQFERVVHIVDSEIVHAMIHRQSYGFNTCVANRVGEIQRRTDPTEWAWIPGKQNISDITTRGSAIEELDAESIWQQGPAFLTEAEDKWPVRFEVNKAIHVPETKSQMENNAANFVGATSIQETLASRINPKRFSSWVRLQSVTARILKLYQRFRQVSGTQQSNMEIDSQDLTKARNF